MVDFLAAANMRQNIILFRVTLGRNDQCNVLTDSLRRAVPEHLLGAAVPRCDDAVQGLADYGVIGRLDDRRETCGHYIGLGVGAHDTTDSRDADPNLTM